MRQAILLAIAVVAVGAACQARPYNPLLGKWAGQTPPPLGVVEAREPGTVEAIFNYDETFALTTAIGPRTLIQEGQYTREGASVRLTVSKADGQPVQPVTIEAKLEQDDKVLSYMVDGQQGRLQKR